jgi:hypothetical protein
MHEAARAQTASASSTPAPAETLSVVGNVTARAVAPTWTNTFAARKAISESMVNQQITTYIQRVFTLFNGDSSAFATPCSHVEHIDRRDCPPRSSNQSK